MVVKAFYFPRSLIRAMISVLDPKVGETIYDAACGSGGFWSVFQTLIKEIRQSLD